MANLLDLFQNLSYIFVKAAQDLGSLHPVVVHFPVALLFAAPLLMVLGFAFKDSSRKLLLSALVLMILGTLALFLAKFTGDLASEKIIPNPAVTATLETHVQLGEQSRLIFSILTIFFLMYVCGFNKFFKQMNPKVRTILRFSYLAVYLFSLLILFSAAHEGGRLVHKHGIHSELYK